MQRRDRIIIQKVISEINIKLSEWRMYIKLRKKIFQHY